MVSVGLFGMDSRIYYVDEDYVVLDDPCDNFVPTLVKRKVGEFNPKEVRRIVSELKLMFDGDPFYRPDGLVCNKLKANGVNNGR